MFSVSFSDLGKRRRWVAFLADLACETAQKLQVGFACVEGGRMKTFSLGVGDDAERIGAFAECGDRNTLAE